MNEPIEPKDDAEDKASAEHRRAIRFSQIMCRTRLEQGAAVAVRMKQTREVFMALCSMAWDIAEGYIEAP